MGEQADPGPGVVEPSTRDHRVEGALELELDEALRRAKAQLSHIRGNLALVATFLTRAEQ